MAFEQEVLQRVGVERRGGRCRVAVGPRPRRPGFRRRRISSIGYLAVARAYAARVRPRMMALLSSAWVIPGLISPALAGTIADHLGWRWIFLGLAPFTAMAAAAATPLVAVGVVIGVPALRDLLPAGALRAAHGPPAAIATLALLSAAFFGAEVFLPLSLTSVRGQSTTVAGLALTAATLTWTGGAWIQARLAARMRRRSLSLGGLLLALAGIAGTAAIVSPSLTAPVTRGIAGLGMGLAYSTLVLEALEGAAAGKEGATSAAVQLANVLGSAVGTGLAGAVLTFTGSAAHSQRAGLAMVGVLTIAVATGALFAGFRLRR